LSADSLVTGGRLQIVIDRLLIFAGC